MKTNKIERFEEHNVILELGVDFEEDNLVPGRATGCLVLPDEIKAAIAMRNGFDYCTYTYPVLKSDTNTIKAKFVKRLYL